MSTKNIDIFSIKGGSVKKLAQRNMAMLLPASMYLTEFGPYVVSSQVSSPELLISVPTLPAKLIMWNPLSIRTFFK